MSTIQGNMIHRNRSLAYGHTARIAKYNRRLQPMAERRITRARPYSDTATVSAAQRKYRGRNGSQLRNRSPSGRRTCDRVDHDAPNPAC